MKIAIKDIKKEEIPRITDIDRSDYSDQIYKAEGSRLILIQSVFNHPGIQGENYQPYIDDLYDVIEKNGKVYGAFDDNRMVGICSIDDEPVGKNKDMLNLGLLWVSKNARRKGIARKLISLCKKDVRRHKLSRMYISATPSRNTIDFYIKMGCRLTKDIDPALYEKEPEDIHMELHCG